MINLLKVRPKVVGSGVVDSSQVTVALKSSPNKIIEIPSGARVSEKQLKDGYKLTISGTGGDTTATLTRKK